MPAILLKFLTPLVPYLASATIMTCGVLYVSHLRHNLAAANAANIALVQTNQANLAAIASYQAQTQKWNAALDALDAQTLVSNNAASAIINTINNTPASADAPVAPVLASALTEISKLQEPHK